MTREPASCVASDTAARAAYLMEHWKVGGIPVVDDLDVDRLVGMITERDLAEKVVAQGLDPRRVKAEEIMTRPAVACREEDELDAAVQLMHARGIGRIPVVDKAWRLVGIISEADLAVHGQETEHIA